ncbi:unnamed protein product [Diamesa serratosioi]
MSEKTLSEAQKRVQDLRKEFIKQTTNPHRHAAGEGGALFDTGLARFQAMRVNNYEHFKPTFKSFRTGFLTVVAPILLYAWAIKSERDGREEKCRTGQVSYADRKFKFI